VVAVPPSTPAVGAQSLTELQALPGAVGSQIVQKLNDGTTWTQTAISATSEYIETFFNAPVWVSTIDYGIYNGTLVVYGTNTNVAGLYPNNIFFASGTPAVGVPPTLTPAPYPTTTGGVTPTGGPTPSSGWVLAATYTSGRGSAVLNENGGAGQSGVVQSMKVGGGEPLRFDWGGGGADSVNAANPLGMSLSTAGLVGAQAQNGALLQVSGQMRADGFSFAITDQSLCPSSSYFATSNAAVPALISFTLGQNYTWTAPISPGTKWGWAQTAGSGGITTITGGAFDPFALVFVQRETVAGNPAIGVLEVAAKTVNSITVRSIDALNAVATTDVGNFQWVVFNADWSS
jgi:hypothetical protein